MTPAAFLVMFAALITAIVLLAVIAYLIEPRLGSHIRAIHDHD